MTKSKHGEMTNGNIGIISGPMVERMKILWKRGKRKIPSFKIDKDKSIIYRSVWGERLERRIKILGFNTPFMIVTKLNN